MPSRPCWKSYRNVVGMCQLTRSRVIQVWAQLCEEHSVSIGMWNEVAEVASGRLEDRSAIVRKSALNLLIMMLQHNPFSPQLRAASFEATLEQYKKKLEHEKANRFRLCEYISYCLSQPSYTDKSMRKLIELFKNYEHALSESSVMDNFRTIINKGKKFAKPELKSCIEEFEEKLNKFHIERKEQELTAKNAQSHQQEVESLESIMVTEKEEEKIDESEITEDSEVTDLSTEAQTECLPSEPGCAESDANHASSEVTDSAIYEHEVQSTISRTRGTTKSRAKNSNKSDQNLDISNCTTSRAKNSNRNDQNLDTSNSTRRITRSRRRS